MDEPILNQNLTPDDQPIDEVLDEVAEEVLDEVAEVDDDPLANAFQYTEPDPPQPKNWPIVLLGVLLAVAFVGGLLWAAGVFDTKKPSQTPDGGTQLGAADVSDLVAMQTENFTITNGMLAFNMERLANYYGSYIDPAVSLKEQTIGTTTWFDYLANSALSDAELLLLMSEVAKKDGTVLSDATLAMAESFATANDLSGYRNGVSEEDARAFWTMYLTALKQQSVIYQTMPISDDAVQAHVTEIPTPYLTCNYVYFPLTIGEKGDFATADEAAATVKTLTDSKTAEEFRTAAVDFLVTLEKYETRADAEKAFDTYCVTKGATYTEGDEISEWLFGKDTAAGDTKTHTTATSVSVYMLTSAPARDTSKTVNVRHILLTSKTYGSDDAAKQKADELLARWKEGDATARSFGALAEEYTEDNNGIEGGLYEGVVEGQMVETFNDWCFDTARKTGDTGIVKTEYGYHIIYFEGAYEAWYNKAVANLKNEAFAKQYDTYKTTYPITSFKENIAKIEL